VDVVPEQYVAESLVAALGDQVSGCRILLARASVARDVIPEELTRLGAMVDVIDAYRTVVPSGAVGRLRDVFSDSTRLPDAVTFTSSSTVKNFLTLWAEAGLGSVPKHLRAISIGPITSATLRECNWEPAAEAGAHDVVGIVDLLRRGLEARSMEERDKAGHLKKGRSQMEYAAWEAEASWPKE
jgi:uroporphyrinogen-III synthase